MYPGDVRDNNNGKSYGGTRSPFNSYGELGYEIPRGSYKFSNIVHTAAGTTFEIDFVEPVFISPLSGGSYNLMGLSQITTMDFDINWDSKLERILSIDEIGLASSNLIPLWRKLCY